MDIQVCVLASGSSGNCTMIRSGDAALLIDAGLSVREIAMRMEQAGCPITSVQGICISHEHSDHTLGLSQLHERLGAPVYTNRGTSEALQNSPNLAELPRRIFATGQKFSVGDFGVEPFSVPHDSYEPVGFVVTAGDTRIGVVTDMGMATTLIRAQLKTCRVVVVESNHDEAMLRATKRPEFLKQRILGRQGHLSNRAAADLMAEVAGPHLDAVFLAHLSAECNDGHLAVRVMRRRLDDAGHSHVKLHLTYPDRISEVWTEPVAAPAA